MNIKTNKWIIFTLLKILEIGGVSLILYLSYFIGIRIMGPQTDWIEKVMTLIFGLGIIFLSLMVLGITIWIIVLFVIKNIEWSENIQKWFKK